MTFDSGIGQDIPFSLRDDTNHDYHSENEISNFNLVKKYMRVVDSDIVNNDSQKDNVKHLQGAVRLIRRSIVEMNPVLNLLNIFCILFLGQQDNDMLEEEICNDSEAVFEYYKKHSQLGLLSEYERLLVEHTALDESRRDYLKKLHTYVLLRKHIVDFNNISLKYLQK